jgi:hypothetical protein
VFADFDGFIYGSMSLSSISWSKELTSILFLLFEFEESIEEAPIRFGSFPYFALASNSVAFLNSSILSSSSAFIM